MAEQTCDADHTDLVLTDYRQAATSNCCATAGYLAKNY
jgi:hypothetical protein